ncbi:MAG TPA: MFS transporter [Solirubrobacteraceae bacterium]
MRRVQLAFGGFTIAEYGTWVSVLVYAYERGGSTQAALVALAQLLPAGLAAPLLSSLADRRGAASALRLGYWTQSLTLAATSALILISAPDLLVYAAAILATTAVTLTRPAQAALIPALVDSDAELTAINSLTGWVESVADLTGTGLAGLLMMFAGPGPAVACFAVCVTVSATLVARVEPARPAPASSEASPDAASEGGVRAGLIAVRNDSGLAALVAVLGAEYLVIGVLDVLLVVLAISVLGLGSAGAGYLAAAFGAGGMLGSLVTLSLIGRRRLSAPMIGAALGWALLLIVLGAWPTVLGAFLLLTAAGTTRTIVDVSGRTLLLREAPAAVRGRVFGLLEGIATLGLALGALLVPAMVALGGAGIALVATGVLLIAITLAVAAAVRRVDRPSSESGALGRLRIEQRGDVIGERVRVA